MHSDSPEVKFQQAFQEESPPPAAEPIFAKEVGISDVNASADSQHEMVNKTPGDQSIIKQYFMEDSSPVNTKVEANSRVESEMASHTLSSSPSVSDDDEISLSSEGSDPDFGSDVEQRAEYFEKKRERQRQKRAIKMGRDRNQSDDITGSGGAATHRSLLKHNDLPKGGRVRRRTVTFEEDIMRETAAKQRSEQQKSEGKKSQSSKKSKQRVKHQKIKQAFMSAPSMSFGPTNQSSISAVSSKDTLGQNKLNPNARATSILKDTHVMQSISRGVKGRISKHKDQIKKTDFEREFQQKNPGFRLIIADETENSLLATVWSKVILLIHTYNFFTVFFFLGMQGFPEELWLVVEVFTEILIVTDFVLRYVIKQYLPQIWKGMWLLHDKGTYSNFHLGLRLLGSLPTSFIAALIYSDDYEMLSMFVFAAIRCLKLLRMRQISQYFDVMDLRNKHSGKNAFYKAFQVAYYFFLATHFIGCMWLLVARLDPDSPEDGWFKMAGYYDYDDTMLERYIDSVFFVVATMTGLGYGNIVPSTNLEWLIDSFIMITGASIYAKFFADFAVEIYERNRKEIENSSKMEQAKQFSSMRRLPDEMQQKVRYFYYNLRMRFDDFATKHRILSELPVSLQGELSLIFNSQLIQNVKFFQLAEPSFILEISRQLSPMISIIGEYVVQIDEVATRMFFIHQGLCEVLASDSITPIAYQGMGCYFGEIGCLITGKRSVSVKVRSTSIIYFIEKENLVELLEFFPQQGKFLRAVGRQRLQTTSPNDLSNTADLESHHDLRSGRFKLSDHKEDLLFSNEQARNLQRATTHVMVRKSSFVPKNPQPPQSNAKLIRTATVLNKGNLGMSMIAKGASFRAVTTQKYVDKNVKTKPWLTDQYSGLEVFLIIPFSKVFWIWNFILCLVIAYDTFMVPFSIALNFDFYGIFFVIDVIAIIGYLVDIFMRAKTAITNPNTYCLDPRQVMGHYVNYQLVFDILACLPFEYALLPLQIDQSYIRYMRLFRLLKFRRVFELVEIVKSHSNFSAHWQKFVQLWFIFILAAHFMACSYIFIGSREVDRKTRFDKQTLFGDFESRTWVTLGPASAMSQTELYTQFLYLSSCTMGAVMYGDIIPFAMSEQLFTFIAMFGARIFLAFLFAEAANYLGSLHRSKTTHTQKVQRIKQWMQINSFPEPLIARVKEYHNILWNDYQGIDESAILKDLPECMTTEIRTFLFRPLIENWQAFPKDNKGALATVVKLLKIQIFPKGEYIITTNEVGGQMYFIVKGLVKVTDQDGLELAQLKQGDNFGEMSLLNSKKPLRTASVISMTKVSLAVLTNQSFQMICQMYPSFEKVIYNIVRERQIINEEHERQKQFKAAQSQFELGQIEEEASSSNSQSSSSSSSCTSSSSNSSSEKSKSPVQGQSKSPEDNSKTFDEDQDSLKIVADIQSGSQKQNMSNKASVVEVEEGANPVRKSHESFCDQVIKELNQIKDDKETSKKSDTSEKKLGEGPDTPELGSLAPSSKKSPLETEQPLQTDRSAQEDQALIIEEQDKPLQKKQSSQTVNHEEPAVIKPVPIASIPTPEPILEKTRKSVASEGRRRSEKRKANQVVPTEIVELNKSGNNSVVSEMRSSGTGSNYKRRRSTIHVRAVDEHLKNVQNERRQNSSVYVRFCNLQNAMRVIMFILVLYNSFFIPLQFAFRTKFEGIVLALEIFTILFYLIDVFLRFNRMSHYKRLTSIPDSNLDAQERKLKADREALDARIRIQKYEIIASIVAAIPFSCAFSFLGITDPWLVIDLFATLRLVKIRSVFNVFKSLKKQSLNTWRIVEVLLYYYMICNWLTCVLISMSAYKEDARETWLRRIPVPVPGDGIREYPSVFTDMSNWSVYVNGFYFVVNTISHVAIGDITSVTTTERLFNAFIILCGTFIYCFLFGNITAIVSSLAPGAFTEFHRQYNSVMSRIENEKIPQIVMNNVNHYFDYQWAQLKGINEEELMKTLPDSIKSDIMLSRYSDMAEGSLVFRESNGQLDVALSKSIFKLVKKEVFLDRDYILKIGQHTTDTCIILDGFVTVYGLYNNESLGVLGPGSVFGNEIGTETQAIRNYKFGDGYKSDVHMEFDDDNFANKSTLHLVASSFVVVARLSSDDTQRLYLAYPDWKIKIQALNRFLFTLGKISVEKYCKSKLKPATREQCMKTMENHLTYSTEQTYNKIIDESLAFNFEEIDLTRMMKTYYLSISPQTVTQKITLQNAVLGKVKTRDFRGGLIHGTETFFCKDFYIEMNSKPRRLLEMIQLINLMYIAVSIPLEIGFNIQMRGIPLLLEAISLIISFIVILLNFRTVAIVKGEMTLAFNKVAEYYWHNGMLIDLFGIIPLNLILGYYVDIMQVSLANTLLVTFFRCTRIVSSWQSLKIFSQFEVYVKEYKMAMGIFKASLMLYFLGHWMTCLWYFTNLVIERDVDQTWLKDNSLDEGTIGEAYLLCYYAVLNVVTSVGYGDMYPVTDLERIFFILMINSGDCLFALAFGLIASITMQQSDDNESKKFIDKMLMIDNFMEAYKISKQQKQKVGQYFAYAFYQKHSSRMLDLTELTGKLPDSLVKEIVYHANKDLLNPMFSDYGSENLIRELSTALYGKIFLPGDFIIKKDEIGDEMYFIVEGQVQIIAADKQTVVNTLIQGSYFGEIAIFYSTRRTSYCQAETFCVINTLKKATLDRISRQFPTVAQDIQHEAEKRMREIRRINDTSSMKRSSSLKSSVKNLPMFGNFMDDSLISDDESNHATDLVSVASLRKHMSNQNREASQSVKGARDHLQETPNRRTGSNKNLYDLLDNQTESVLGAMEEHKETMKKGEGFLKQVTQTLPRKSRGQRRGTLLLAKTRGSASYDNLQLESKQVIPQQLPKSGKPDPKKKDTSISIMARDGERHKEIDKNNIRRGNKLKRRLSGISLGKNLKLSQNAGLKLQWTVGN